MPTLLFFPLRSAARDQLNKGKKKKKDMQGTQKAIFSFQLWF